MITYVNFHYFKALFLMMPFFNQNWAGACGVRWAEPESMAGWSAGSWIVEAEVGLLQCWSIGSGRGSPLQKQERRGIGEGFARGRFDA